MVDPYQLRIHDAGRQMAALGWSVHVTHQMMMGTGLVAWTADLAHRGQPVATIDDHGTGGAPLVRFTAGHRGGWPQRWRADLAAGRLDEETAVAGLDLLDLETDLLGDPTPAAVHEPPGPSR